MTELFSNEVTAQGEDTLEHAAERSKQFLDLVAVEIEALGFAGNEEKLLQLAEQAIPGLTTVQAHYALREVMAQAYTSVAYRALAAKWAGT